jgi:peptide-methionine (R)-S-oxide reductase
MSKEKLKPLSPEQRRVLREGGTEPPFSGKLLYNKKEGLYQCAACGNALFRSDTKFDSGTGWPSFSGCLDGVETKKGRGFLRSGKEVRCARCGSHLGHVFDDGPEPTGKRYCINSLALDFKEDG